jgi:hypothetical protein
MVLTPIQFEDITITRTHILVQKELVEVLQLIEHELVLYLMYRKRKRIYSRHFSLDQKTLHLILYWHGTFLRYRLPKAEKVTVGTCTRQTLVHSDNSVIIKMQKTAFQMIGLIHEYFPMRLNIYGTHCHTVCPANQSGNFFSLVFESIIKADHCTSLHYMLRDFYHLFHTREATFIIGLLSLNVLGCQFELILKGLDYPDPFLESLTYVSFGIINHELVDGYVLKPILFNALELKLSLVDLLNNEVQMTPLVKQLLELTRLSFVSSDDRCKLYVQNDDFVELENPNYSDRFDVEYQQEICLSSY